MLRDPLILGIMNGLVLLLNRWHYIPTRYPNFHPEGAPLDYYTKEDAERAVRCAEEIVEYCRRKILRS